MVFSLSFNFTFFAPIMDGINFPYISLPPPIWFEIHLQILVPGKLMAKVQAPDTGSCGVNPRTTWAVPCNYAEWCGFMNTSDTNRPFLRIQCIFILHLFAFKFALSFHSLSQVTIRDLWPYPSFHCCLGILSKISIWPCSSPASPHSWPVQRLTLVFFNLAYKASMIWLWLL